MIYTSRSTGEAGHWCQRRRWWQYHGGPNGFGIAPKAQAVPLLTGTEVHEVLAGILLLAGAGGRASFELDEVSRAQIRTMIRAAQKKYRDQVAQLGLADQRAGEEPEKVVAEQCCLLAGLTWGWVRAFLPRILSEYQIIAVEQEEEFIIGCGCGKGDRVGTVADHVAELDQMAVCYQSRPDWAAIRRGDKQVGIHDFKTTSYNPDEKTIEQYRVSVQMTAGTLGIERRIGKPVTHYIVHFLHKGQRRKGYSSPGVFDGPRQQQSHFCYVTYMPANPPLNKEQLLPEGKWYQKAPVWELDPVRPAGWTVEEFWVSKMPEETLYSCFTEIGPYDRQSWMIPGHLRSVLAEERRWAAREWEVYRLQKEEGLTLKDALDEMVPQSWDCFRYNSTCYLKGICVGEIPTDNQAIMATGLFQLRVPHHKPELDALAGSGRELPKEMLLTGEGTE